MFPEGGDCCSDVFLEKSTLRFVSAAELAALLAGFAYEGGWRGADRTDDNNPGQI